MYSFTSRGAQMRTVIVAVLQAFLLTSALVLAPVQAIAQEEPAPSHAAGDTAEPLAEAVVTSQPAERPGPTVQRSQSKPKAGADPVAAPAPAEVKIRIHPQRIKIREGGKKIISAWTCPADDRSPFGRDRKPGTADDECDPIRVTWSLKDPAAASLSNKRGPKTRVTLDTPTDTKLIARAQGMTRKAPLLVKDPGVLAPKAAQAAAERAAPPAAEAPKDTPKVDSTAKPTAEPSDEPTAEPTEPTEPTDDPTAEPSAEPTEPTDDPTAEPSAKPTEPTDDPTAEPSAKPTEPTDDPTAEPSAKPTEPTDDPTAEPSAEPTEPTDDPPAEPSAEPTEPAEPSAEPNEPTDDATAEPNQPPKPTAEPTEPTDDPTAEPNQPSKPTAEPTEPTEPTDDPTAEPEPAAFEAAAEPAAADGAADLDQCANGGVGETPTQCNPNEWVNGNLGASKAHYAEGEVLPYRMKLSGLQAGGPANTLTIEWDTTKSGLHALDYIATYNHTVTNADPCVGVSGCSGAADDTYPIPIDSLISGAGVTQVPGVISIWGGDITGLSTYFYSNGTGFGGDKKAGITISFTAGVSNPVIAWGGHIASRFDWGPGMAAGTIPGSPYHTRLISLNGQGGNQDRSLSAAAVLLESRISIIKQADPEDDTQFDFTTTGGLSPAAFSLQDPSSKTRTFTGIFDYSTYTVSESAAPGWDLSFKTPVCDVVDANGGSQSANDRTITINLKEGELVSCTFKNKLQKGTLIVEKQVVNDNGGNAVATDFIFDVAGPSAQSNVRFEATADPLQGKNTFSVDAGDYTVTEQAASGYTASYSNCTNVTVAAGQTITCTFTNDDDAPGLILAKHVVTDNGGSAEASEWTLYADALAVSGAEGGTQVTDQVGHYELTESAGPEGYTNTSISCDDDPGVEVTAVSLGLGQTITCTFTNDDDAPGLILAKHVVTDNGGSAEASEWTLYADALAVSGAEGGTQVTDQVGHYELTESAGPEGYTNTSISCDDDPGVEVTAVSLGLGQTITCTFTNDDDAPGLILAKHVVTDNGGSAEASEWTLYADALAVSGAEGGTQVTDQVGHYELTESAGPEGYTNTSISCDDDPGVEVTAVSLGLGQTITCTFTNDDDAPGLILAKHVVTDNGGSAEASEWTLYADALAVSGAEGGTQVTDQVGHYELTESAGPEGYTNTSISCDDDPGVEVTAVSLGLGQTITCTFTNDDDAPGLILAKHVVTDNGGSAEASEWTLYADALAVSGAEGGTQVTDQVGHYELTESAGPEGYTNTSISCDDDPGVEVTAVSLGLGQTITCTFTNDDDAPGLILAKHVVTDNGGSAEASEWTLYADALAVSGAEGGTQVTDQVGHYELTELAGPEGYTNTSISCDDDPGVEVTAVSLGLGQTITCTFTNDDDAPGLILAKHVVTDNGGSAEASEWTLYADALAVSGAEGGTQVTDQVGHYELTELAGPEGYTNTSISCDDDPGVEVTAVSLGLGQTITCTFVNDDDRATVTLVKTVSGGDASEADFTPSIDTGEVTWGVAVPVIPGDYTASETMAVTDYVAGDWGEDCDADGTFSIALGQHLTCTITNYYAELDIEKSAEPSFYAEVGDVISYSITATNTGVATLTNVDVSDEFPGGLEGWQCDAAMPATLAPGESVTCTATHTIVEADIEAGTVFNQACVSSDETSQDVCDDETVQLSELEIVKAADVDFYDAVGDVINYTITATNTGESALTDVDISDNLFDELDDWQCTPTLTVDELAPDETVVCTASYTIVAADIEAGSVFNQACALSNETPTVCDDVETPLAQLEITKSAEPATYAQVGDEIDYTVTATNTGQAILTDVDISDDLIDGLASWECKIGDTVTTVPADELFPGQAITCTATYTIVEADITAESVPNTACAISDQTPEVCDEVDVPLANLEIVKTADVSFYSAVGDEIGYTVTATNVGQAILTNVDISDDLIDGLDSWECTPALTVDELAPGQAITCTATYTIVEADITAESVPNTACAISDQTPEVCDEVDVPLAQLDIVKTADVDFYSAVGDEINYTISVTNVGAAEVTNLDVSDALIDGLDSWACVPGNPVASLAPGDSVVCTASYVIVEADITAESVPNTACAISDQTPEVCDEVDVPLAELDIVKTADVDVFTAVGDVIGYTVTATNVGQATLTNVDISDDLVDGLADWQCTPALTVDELAPGESITCSATYEITQADLESGSVPNTACADSDETPEVCDSVDVLLAELEIVKTAVPGSFQAIGDEILYTVTATNVGQAILTDVDISDELIDGLDSWACTPENPADSLAPGDSITCTATYVITEADYEATEVLNSACVVSSEAPEVCDDVIAQGPIEILIDKSPEPAKVFSGEAVTFKLEIRHQMPFSLWMDRLDDDIYGDLLDPDNPDLVSSDCALLEGIEMLPDTAYGCEFVAIVTGKVRSMHTNVATVVATDVDDPDAEEARFAEASDDATVKIKGGGGSGGGGGQPPTDMLIPLETVTSGGTGALFGGTVGWMLWLLFSAMLIVGTGWIIRQERFAEA